MDLNKVMLIGRLTRDPESRTTPSGITVTSFSLATSRVWKDQQGQQKEQTEFHNIIAWRRLGEIVAQYLKKGRQAYVEGHLQTSSWDDKTSGQKRYKTEIVADNLIMLGSKGDSTGSTGVSFPAAQNQNTPAMSPAMSVSTAPITDEEIRIEDIPF
ncbi:MAG: single-stranded DNA-binding protein [Candidatus Andersenbacteria bacterium]|nr:single-stranded DNA-binding protein [Candidatus Andersenbacteria bacterium]